MRWHSVKAGDLPPTYQENPCDNWASKPVLVRLSSNRMLVATLEHWEDTDTPEWFSNCSEHWNLGDTVTHWQELPKGPQD